MCFVKKTRVSKERNSLDTERTAGADWRGDSVVVLAVTMIICYINYLHYAFSVQCRRMLYNKSNTALEMALVRYSSRTSIPHPRWWQQRLLLQILR